MDRIRQALDLARKERKLAAAGAAKPAAPATAALELGEDLPPPAAPPAVTPAEREHATDAIVVPLELGHPDARHSQHLNGVSSSRETPPSVPETSSRGGTPEPVHHPALHAVPRDPPGAARAQESAAPNEAPFPPALDALAGEALEADHDDPAAVIQPKAFDADPVLFERNRIVVDTRDAPAARAFRMLRTQVLQRMDARQWRTIGVVSARSGDGKTTTAINLALTIAGSPRHTALLVDLDLRRPAVGSTLGLAPEQGVEEVLAGSCALPAALYRLRTVDGLVVLPARAPVEKSSELLAAVRSEQLIRELRTRYPDRIVLFDLPPVLEAEDASVIAPYLDCVLFVACEGRTIRDDVAESLRMLSRTTVVGTVLNQAHDLIQTEAYG